MDIYVYIHLDMYYRYFVIIGNNLKIENINSDKFIPDDSRIIKDYIHIYFLN